eukprot:evm.model.scf_462.4 EVM.evm.TU.scf_462.4   scf_462:18879-19714(-)
MAPILDTGRRPLQHRRQRHHYGDGGLVRSLHSKVSTHVSFVNNLDVPVAILWLNYRGDEVLYATLRPGARYRQQTYVTHPWTFRCTRGGNPNDVVVGHRRVLFPTRQESVVAMERPAAAGAAGMRWSIDRHWYFKWWPGFASGVRALLMCHKRLERQRRAEGAAAGRGCAAAPTLGDLPLEVVLLVVRWMAPADMAVVLPPQEGVLGVKIDARDLGAHLDAAAADPKGEEDPTVAAPGGARGTG